MSEPAAVDEDAAAGSKQVLLIRCIFCGDPIPFAWGEPNSDYQTHLGKNHAIAMPYHATLSTFLISDEHRVGRIINVKNLNCDTVFGARFYLELRIKIRSDDLILLADWLQLSQKTISDLMILKYFWGKLKL